MPMENDGWLRRTTDSGEVGRDWRRVLHLRDSGTCEMVGEIGEGYLEHVPRR